MVDQKICETLVGTIVEMTRDSRGDHKALLDLKLNKSSKTPFYVIEEDRISEVDAESKRQKVIL